MGVVGRGRADRALLRNALAGGMGADERMVRCESLQRRSTLSVSPVSVAARKATDSNGSRLDRKVPGWDVNSAVGINSTRPVIATRAGRMASKRRVREICDGRPAGDERGERHQDGVELFARFRQGCH